VSSGAPQLSQVGGSVVVPDIALTLTPTVGQVSWRWLLAVASLTVAACGDDEEESGAKAALEPTTAAATSTSGARPVGFDQTAAEVTLADGTVCELCLWVADTPAERSRGLMGVTDLGGADGMVFVYDAPTQGQFWMRNTVMPLSIGFFAADGSFVSSTDMQPCLEGPDSACARYGATGEYTAAIEMPLGDLAELGIGPGTRFERLATPCAANGSEGHS
jgi:uncharacterized protein